MNDEAFAAAGNAVFVIPSVVVLIYALSRGRRMAQTFWGRIVVIGLLTALFGVVLRIGQWLISQWMREPPVRYAEWVYLYRDEVTMLSAVIYTIGCSFTLAGLARRGTLSAWVAGGALLGLGSAAIGYVLTPQ